MKPINFEAAGLLFDILPNKNWHYCGWCSRPIILNDDVRDHPQIENLLTTLGCRDESHRDSTLPLNLYIESELASYVFPYSDEILYGVAFDHQPEFKDVVNAQQQEWETLRDKVVSSQYILVWTRKVVGFLNSGLMDIVPRHPQLALSYLD